MNHAIGRIRARRALAFVAMIAAVAPAGARADEEQRLPIQDPGVVGKIAAINPCVSESEYDVPVYYGDECKRLKIVFGPIVVNPGKNDVLIQPVTFEKPMWDGYMTRFKPGLFDVTGKTPPVESLHLHHGTWLNASSYGAPNIGPVDSFRSYGDGPWFATGEEKTINALPYRYGIKIKGTDVWLFLHMVHSAVTSPTVVFVSYDIDYVAADVAETLQADGKPLINNTKQLWLDVGGGGNWSDGIQNDDQFPFNPVYNVQAGFGGSSADTATEYKVPASEAAIYGLGDDETALDVCRWPDDNCARENSSGRVSRNQGNDVSASVEGWDKNISAAYDGSLVVMGGHLHMGGINDTVSLVREFTAPDGITKRRFSKIIHISDAYYWNWNNSAKVGAAPISWDVSMSGVSADIGWKVRIKQGDRLRLNADYDTSIGSWYENMGIVMTWVAPGDTTGLDPFRGCAWDGGSSLSGCQVEINHGLLPDKDTSAPPVPSDVWGPITASGPERVMPIGVNRPEPAPGWTEPGGNLAGCSPSATVLCTRGQITHGHIGSSSNHTGCRGTACSDSLLATAPEWVGDPIDEIHMAGFLYGPGDFGQIPVTGIPEVALGSTVTFLNEDMFALIPHTATLCGYPCTGSVNTHYPIPDGGQKVVATPATGDDPDFTVEDPDGDKALDAMDFDTTELGINLGTPTLGEPQNARYELKATRTGVYTYFCRIHPFMRGAFEVVA
jgi:plastocyanin